MRSALPVRLLLGVSVLTLATAEAAFAQQAASRPAAAADAEPMHPDDEAYEVDELVVSASREMGAVIGDIKPEIQLTPRDIRAYGVSSVSDLITALAPQTTSGRGSGRPVILVNGQRISSFVEVRDIPTEAIVRVDILPEEVSLKYGYRADQRVINLVLRPRFRATTAEVTAKTPTQGAGESGQLELGQFRVRRESRLLIDGKVGATNSVLESDRSIANTTGDAAFRTLQPESTTAALTAVYAAPIREGLAGSVNGSIEASRNESLLGRRQENPTAGVLADPSALARVTETASLHVGGAMNGALKGWSWALTANADRGDTRTTIDRSVAGSSFTDKTQAVSNIADVELTANGRLTDAPAGAVSTSFKVSGTTSRFDTRAVRAGVLTTGNLGRDIGSVQANLDIPLASRGKGVLEPLGDLSANLNVEASQLSDFGALTTLGYGFNWSPITPVRLLFSVTEGENAPSVNQLGDPVAVTQGARVFDFLRGETVEVTRIEGGSPNLDSDHSQVVKLGANLKPFSKTDITIQADYVRTRLEDMITAFPTATSQIEAAFPDRFVRDATGRLVQIDSRPVNFDRRDTEQLRWGFTFRKPLGPTQPAFGAGRTGQAGQRTPGAATDGQRQQPQPQAGQAQNTAAPPPGDGPPIGAPPAAGPGGPGGGPGGIPGFPGRGGGFGGGNLQIGLYHTVKFKDEIVIRPGVPTLDLLDGAALGNSGGVARHQIDLQANVSKSGYGAAMNASWQSGSEVRGGTFGDLKFEPMTTVNLRLFADLGVQPWVRRDYPWLRGVRATLAIDNLFDVRQTVRSASGVTPVNFQPDYLDPLGAQVRLSVRKLFF